MTLKDNRLFNYKILIKDEKSKIEIGIKKCFFSKE
ncbi:hypothetical protein J2783_003285 [Chryseobacterium sediminis]|jgi:hypothetical protein|nr:hypothetical protein [Chryseobacterium sediminis]